MKTKPESVVGLLAVLFFTFGINGLEFENLVSWANSRPVIMIAAGIATSFYWYRIRSMAKSK